MTKAESLEEGNRTQDYAAAERMLTTGVLVNSLHLSSACWALFLLSCYAFKQALSKSIQFNWGRGTQWPLPLETGVFMYASFAAALAFYFFFIATLLKRISDFCFLFFLYSLVHQLFNCSAVERAFCWRRLSSLGLCTSVRAVFKTQRRIFLWKVGVFWNLHVFKIWHLRTWLQLTYHCRSKPFLDSPVVGEKMHQNNHLRV